MPRDGFRPIVDSDASESGGGNLAVYAVLQATTDVKPGLPGRVVGERGDHNQRLARFGHRIVRLTRKIGRSLSGWRHGMVGLAGKIDERETHHDTRCHCHHCGRDGHPEPQASAGWSRGRIRFSRRYGRYAGGGFRGRSLGRRSFRLEVCRD